MADGTDIEWTDATWNPITGCSVVSPGCTNCYAMKLAGTRLKHHPSRKGLTTDTKAGPVWNGKLRFNKEWLSEPLRWKRPRRIFVCAHGDLFAEGVPDEWMDQVFAVMALSPRHTFQVLTKRPERMCEYLSHPATVRRIYDIATDMVILGGVNAVLTIPENYEQAPAGNRVMLGLWPILNVWLGVSVEDQRRADERIPILLDTPAALRWISAEPLLGPLTIQKYLALVQPFNGRDSITFGLDWVVAGGESGPGARPMHPDWARSLRDQCAASGVPFLFKQWGAWLPVDHMSDQFCDSLYLPARMPDGVRHCTVDTTVLDVDAQRHGITDQTAFQQGKRSMTMMKVGKRRAGRLLDGIEHNAFPETTQ